MAAAAADCDTIAVHSPSCSRAHHSSPALDSVVKFPSREPLTYSLVRRQSVDQTYSSTCSLLSSATRHPLPLATALVTAVVTEYTTHCVRVKSEPQMKLLQFNKRLANAKRPCDCSVSCLHPKSSL